MAPPQNIVERGAIISVDARRHVYRVHLNSGRTMKMARIRSHPGDLVLLTIGTFVVVTFALGVPYITGVLPPDTSSTYDDNPASVTDVAGHGGNDPTLSGNLGVSSRGPNEPQDITAGDFVGSSPDGASVAALHGKVAQIRGSALAKVQAFGDNDLVRIVAGVLETMTWMGKSAVVNNEGKTSFIWRGGSDQLTQTGPDEERYTIKLDVGHTGDMLKLELCTRNHQTLFRFHVNPEGRVELYAAGGFDQHSGASPDQVHPVNFNGSVEEHITGDASRRVVGNVSETHEGSRTESISTNHSTSVGQDYIRHIGRNARFDVGGDFSEVVSGSKSVNAFGNIAQIALYPGSTHTIRTEAGNSSIETNTGDHTVTTLGGTITLNAGPGHISLLGAQVLMSADNGAFTISAAPSAIQIGNGAVSGVTKWEELNTAIQTLTARLNTLHGLIASHAHVGAAPIDPTLAPLNTPLAVDISPARSAARVG